MPVTATELAARLTAEAAASLSRLAAATPKERLSWEPLENGRSILNQLAECAVANTKWAAILRSRKYANLPPSAAAAMFAEITDREKALAALATSAADLVEAIRSVPVEDLDEPIETEWEPMTLARCCAHACWNMTYHEGQISYVQTLYGDFDEH